MLDQWEIRTEEQTQPCSGPQVDRLEQGWKCLLKLKIVGKAGLKAFNKSCNMVSSMSAEEREIFAIGLSQYIKEQAFLKELVQ